MSETITSVEVQVLRDVPTPRELRFAWAPGSVTRSSSITLIRLRTSGGLEGIGTGGSPEATRAVGQQLVGQSPFDTERHSKLLRRGGNAWGLEVALWDVIG
jgi:L-alanine-DL-glutamate epimerase-like enolase superfamily enzyme